MQRSQQHRRLRSSGTKAVAHTEQSLLREHLAPFQQQQLYQQVMNSSSILYPKGTGPQKPGHRRIQSQVDPPTIIGQNSKSIRGDKLLMMAAEKLQKSTIAIASDWNSRHQLDNNHLHDLQTLRAATCMKYSYQRKMPQVSQSLQPERPTAQAQQNQLAAPKSQQIKPKLAAPFQQKQQQQPIYTRKAMQQRFAKKSNMRTEGEIVPLIQQQAKMLQGCFNGQRTLQITKIVAQQPSQLPTTLTKKQVKLHHRYPAKEETTSMQTCLSELNNYEVERDQHARSSLTAHFSSALSNGEGMSRNGADASTSCAAGRFFTATTAPHQSVLSRKISHNRYYSTGQTQTSTQTTTPRKSLQVHYPLPENKKCYSQKKKSDSSVGAISVTSHRRNNSYNNEFSVRLLESFNVDSDDSSSQTSIRTLRVDEVEENAEGATANGLFQEAARMLPKISFENTEQ